MKSLLIHNDNFCHNKNIFERHFKFTGDITNFIKDRLIETSGIDCFVIPISLSENYLEFLGIELAYHIRLTKELKDLRFVPIIFFGEETPYLISKLSTLGRILYTDGIYVTKGNNIEELLRKKLNGTTQEKIQEQIEFSPPSNYSSHHSVANEWSILRWSKYLGIDSRDDFKRLIERIGSSLYYKYLLNKYPIPLIEKGEIRIEGNGKVLLIDDEYKKGWKIIFKEIFKSGDFKFEVLEQNFEMSKDEIVNSAIRKTEEFDPDIVLLDFRLHTSEFYDTEIDKFISVEILRKIKVLNPGIQIVIFTASNKVWSLQKLESLGADGFILKESPEFNHDNKFTRENIKSFRTTIENSLCKKYLKEMYSNKNEIIEKLNNLRKDKQINKDFQKEMQNLIKLSFQVLTKQQTNEVYSIAFINLFNSIELIANEYINEKEPVNKNDKYLYNFYDGTPVNYYKWEGSYVSKGRLKRDNKTFQLPSYMKIINYAKEKTSMEDYDIYKIENLVALRNDYIHQNLVNGSPVRIEKANIEELFKYVYQLIMEIKV